MTRPQRPQRVVVAAVLKVLSTVVSAAAAGPPAEVKVFGMQLDTWAPPLPDVVVTYNLSLNIPQVRAFLPFFLCKISEISQNPCCQMVNYQLCNYVVCFSSSSFSENYPTCPMKGESAFISTYYYHVSKQLHNLDYKGNT